MSTFGFGGLMGSKKCLFRKTGETVEVVASYNPEDGARTDADWVSYIDSEGTEHIREHLNIQFDFKDEDEFSSRMEKLLEEAKSIDPWEARRYELAKEIYLKMDNFEVGLVGYEGLVERADRLIAALKNSPEAEEFVEGVQMDDGYENIGIGEIVEAIDRPERLKKFVFTDKKDIVGFRGDGGRWTVGDRVKVYIKRLKPEEEERPVP